MMCADAEELPFADGVFDKVFCIGAIMHMHNEEAACREMVRVLRHGGQLVMSFNSLLHPLAVGFQIYVRVWKRLPGYKQSFRLPRYYTRLLAQAGCTPRLYAGTFSYGRGGRVALKMWERIDRFLGTAAPWATFEPIIACTKR